MLEMCWDESEFGTTTQTAGNKKRMDEKVQTVQDKDNRVAEKPRGDTDASDRFFSPTRLGNWGQENDPVRQRMLQVFID